jgi:hypothetical protein
MSLILLARLHRRQDNARCSLAKAGVAAIADWSVSADCSAVNSD